MCLMTHREVNPKGDPQVSPAKEFLLLALLIQYLSDTLKLEDLTKKYHNINVIKPLHGALWGVGPTYKVISLIYA